MEELPPDIHERINALSQEGNEFQEIEEWDRAIAAFEAALFLIPEPRYQWEASAWLFAAIGDVAFLSGQYERAREALRQAMLCPGAIGNPFVHLRRGQTFFELGEIAKAEEELTGAYMLEGPRIFAGEEPKYFEHLKAILGPPASGHW